MIAVKSQDMFLRSMLISCVMLATVSAELVCKLVSSDITHVMCRSDGNDSVLKRGLIPASDDVVKVILRRCRITDIDYDGFHGLPSVTDIDLSYNKLKKIKLGTLEEARNTTHLNLSYNDLTGLPVGVFDKQKNLISLNLHRNSIENLQHGIFSELSNLTFLDLSFNKILGNHLNSNIFDENPNISHIVFSGNNMMGTNDRLLHPFRGLEVLMLTQCMLDEVPTFATADNLKTMKKLFLTENRINAINNPRTFVNLESLEILNIGFNKLNSVNENVFKSLTKLKVIDLSKNNLKSIPETLFLNMRSLTNIDISGNFLTFIQVNAFRGTSVINLNLSNNRFSYLTDNFCLELKNSGTHIQTFYFDQNPWQCMCLLDILKEVNKLQIEYNSVKYDGAQAVCVTRELTCKRQESFNEIYVDMYDKLIRNVSRTT